MQKITPFLWFDSNAEEAVKFYVSVFSKKFGSAPVKKTKIGTVTRYDEAGAQATGRPKGSLMTATFWLNGQEFIALNAGPQFKFNEAISFVVNCKDQKEVDYFWEKLTADGGQESMCGWLKDKFGLSWQITPEILTKLMSSKDPKKSQRAMQAMLQMKKIIISDLKKAQKGKQR